MSCTCIFMFSRESTVGDDCSCVPLQFMCFSQTHAEDRRRISFFGRGLERNNCTAVELNTMVLTDLPSEGDMLLQPCLSAFVSKAPDEALPEDLVKDMLEPWLDLKNPSD